MADIYYPLDSTSAKVIQAIIPPGEDVIYSTLCKIKYSTPPPFVEKKRYRSQVLLTNKGVAYINYTVKRCIYFDWAQVRGIYYKKVIEIFAGLDLVLVRDPDFETKEDFKKRTKEFASKIKPVMNARKEEWVRLFPDKKERKKKIRERYNEVIRRYDEIVASLDL
jgi:hypothetical protein